MLDLDENSRLEKFSLSFCLFKRLSHGEKILVRAASLAVLFSWVFCFFFVVSALFSWEQISDWYGRNVLQSAAEVTFVQAGSYRIF